MPVMRNQTAYKPFYEALGGDVRLYLGDVRAVLKNLPAQSVHCVITSPPYWGLRDYGTGTWEGGDLNCDHQPTKEELLRAVAGASTLGGRLSGTVIDATMIEKERSRRIRSPCPKCGAKRIDQQIGSEPTPDEFVATMVDVFREVHRVLRDDGTVWLNLGDTYSGSANSGGIASKTIGGGRGQITNAGSFQDKPRPKIDLQSGNLIGIPWRVALALQADGWILRQDIIWHKPSPMPESISDRCTKAHEYIFLLCKRKPYYYDADAIREGSADIKGSTKRYEASFKVADGNKSSLNEDRTLIASIGAHGSLQQDGQERFRDFDGRRNKRSVWTVTSQGYEGSHFACFPQKLIEPCILAGVPEKCCSQCGAPHLRLTEKTQLTRERPHDYVKRIPSDEEERQRKAEILSRTKLNNVPGRSPISTKSTLGPLMNTCANSVAGVNTKTIGWQPQCDCNASVVGGTVLDPFVGSGTTVVVALQNNRKGIGIDLSQTYLLDNTIPRIEGACHDMPELAKRLGKQAKVLTGGTLLKR